MHIEIERVTADKLGKVLYWYDVGFTAGGNIGVRFRGYRVLSRRSRRHRTWNVDARWDWRTSGSVYVNTTTKPEVPADVQAEVIAKLRSAIVFIED